uniref:Ig-like domain-containing protein n=1 Tax=Mola mola TaxID=94237 RepID=A0A3Q3XGB6_MOLML
MTDCSITIINIFGKTKYQFRVVAENEFGLSLPSVPTEPITMKEDKSVIRNYDEEVDETREITKEEALFYKVKELSFKYIISEELARCQFGAVHRCVEISTKKTFMAKFIKVKGTDRELVLREIEALNVASNGFASIYVKDIEESDDGVYKCKVVIDNIKLLQRPPEFTLPLYNRTAYIGEDVRFGVTITVHPEPHVTWLKNGERIKPGDDDSKYTFTSDTGLYQLMKYVFTNMSGVLSITILGCQEEDSGTYRCVCSNSKGEASDYATLDVSGSGYTTFSSRRKDEDAHKVEDSNMSSLMSETYAMSSSSLTGMASHMEGSSFRAIGETFKDFKSSPWSVLKFCGPLTLNLNFHCTDVAVVWFSGSAPRIEALPEDISIEPGKILTVACAFSGDAKHIEWSRGGRIIDVTAGRRFHIETTEDLTTLIITGVREEDAGTYTLKLSNELGSDSATVHISIRSV